MECKKHKDKRCCRNVSTFIPELPLFRATAVVTLKNDEPIGFDVNSTFPYMSFQGKPIGIFQLNNGIFVPIFPGLYLFSVAVVFSSGDTRIDGDRYVRLTRTFHNGPEPFIIGQYTYVTSSNTASYTHQPTYTTLSLTHAEPLCTNDSVQVGLYFNTTNTNITTITAKVELVVVKLSILDQREFCFPPVLQPGVV
jgi:hypothetical protein